MRHKSAKELIGDIVILEKIRILEKITHRPKTKKALSAVLGLSESKATSYLGELESEGLAIMSGKRNSLKYWAATLKGKDWARDRIKELQGI